MLQHFAPSFAGEFGFGSARTVKRKFHSFAGNRRPGCSVCGSLGFRRNEQCSAARSIPNVTVPATGCKGSG
jgi:hypothetical protein